MNRDDWRWFHLMTHTYGAWLPGDPRGFRTRHHREHIDGDYRNPPPPGIYDDRLRRSRSLLKQPMVEIPNPLRPVVAAAIAEKLLEYHAVVLCVSVDNVHVHALAKMPPAEVPRLWFGYAKREATFRWKARGWVGKLWQVRCKVEPISDRDHQLNSFGYILKHRLKGASIWDFREHRDQGDVMR